MRPRLVTVPRWFPVPWYGYSAITLYPFLLFRKGWDTPRTRRHELIHFMQVKRAGWFRFYLQYLWDALRFPYREIPAEKEAYMHDNDPGYLPARLEAYVHAE